VYAAATGPENDIQQASARSTDIEVQRILRAGHAKPSAALE